MILQQSAQCTNIDYSTAHATLLIYTLWFHCYFRRNENGCYELFSINIMKVLFDHVVKFKYEVIKH